MRSDGPNQGSARSGATSGQSRVRWRKIQWCRRIVQLSVLAFIVAVPVLAQYGNYLASREIDALRERWEGTLPGLAMDAADGALRSLPDGEVERAGRFSRNEEEIARRLQSVRGNAWSAQIGPVSVTDPLAAAESFAASRRVVNVAIVGLLIPLAVTILFGRVYCSWLCPMNLFLEVNDRLRRLLRFLEIRTFDVRFPRGVKYLTLALGLLLAWLWARPILGSFYPPAVIGREARGLVATAFDRAEEGVTGWTLRGLSSAALVIVGIALFELLVSRRWWCRYVCPGGALYSLFGGLRLVRVARDAKACTECGDCVRVCPMGLAPMQDRFGIECDNCGLCISHCGDAALAYRVGWRDRPRVPSCDGCASCSEGSEVEAPRNQEVADASS